MREALHLSGPLQKTPEVMPFAPGEFPEFQKPDLRHLDAGVGLNAPEQIRTAPRCEMVALCRIP